MSQLKWSDCPCTVLYQTFYLRYLPSEKNETVKLLPFSEQGQDMKICHQPVFIESLLALGQGGGKSTTEILQMQETLVHTANICRSAMKLCRFEGALLFEVSLFCIKRLDLFQQLAQSSLHLLPYSTAHFLLHLITILTEDSKI